MALFIWCSIMAGVGKSPAFGRKHGVKHNLQDASHVPAFVLRESRLRKEPSAAAGKAKKAEKAEKAKTAETRKDEHVPVEYRLGGFHNWQQAEDFCKTREGRLCTQKELCPDGELKPPVFGMVKGDIFTATMRESDSKQIDCADKDDKAGGRDAKSTNSWLAIGDMMPEVRLCRHHHQFGGCPGWGESDHRDHAGLKAVTYCCGPKVPKTGWCFDTHTDDEVMLKHVQVWPKAKMGAPKIMCMAYTHAKKHEQAASMVENWMHRCDDYLLASDKTQQITPLAKATKLEVEGGESYKNMYNKVRSMWRYAHQKHLDDFDWFFISGDDQYMVVENLRQYLLSPTLHQKHTRGDSLYLGRRYRSFMGEFNTGGGGYLLNSHALKDLIGLFDEHAKGRKFRHSPCRSKRTSMEDVYIARCLREKGIVPYDTRDSDGSERFHPFQPGVVLMYRSAKAKDWFQRYTVPYDRKEGIAAVSTASITFHYILPKLQKESTRILYSCNGKSNGTAAESALLALG